MIMAAQAIEGRLQLPPGTDDQIDPSKLRTDLTGLAAQIQEAQRFAGSGRPGRPVDDAAFDLLHAVSGLVQHPWSRFPPRLDR